jgi:hypothetical protein
MQLVMIALSLKLQSDMVFNAMIATIMFQQVFEKAIHAFDKALEDSEDKYLYQFWQELLIRTNLARELMVVVFVQCPQDVAADRIERLNEELKEFFENGEGRKCGVVSLYTRVTYTYVHLKHRQLPGFMQTELTVNVTNILCLLFIVLSYLMTTRRSHSVKWEVDSKHQIGKNVEGRCYDLF